LSIVGLFLPERPAQLHTQGIFTWNRKSLIWRSFSEILNFSSQMHFYAAPSRQMKMPWSHAR
jgi:hypothetical protein